jgi:hypothetical protein
MPEFPADSIEVLEQRLIFASSPSAPQAANVNGIT